MPSFGEQLRRERESRNTALAEIADSTKIQPGYLEALERNEFDALPGRSFGKLYIRAYAEVLGFDPRPLIAAYDREHQNQARRTLEEEASESVGDAAGGSTDHEVADGPQEKAGDPPQGEIAEAPPEAPVETPVAEVPDEPVETPVEEVIESPPAESIEIPEEEVAEPRRTEPVEQPLDVARGRPFDMARARRTALVAALLLVGLVALTSWVYFAFLRTGAAESETAVEPVRPRVETGREPAETAVAEDPPDEAGATTAPPEPAPAAASPGSGRLSVPEFGVGRRVVNHRLQGRGQRFEEGTVVWFWTRVLGGRAGQSVRHVWLHEGRPVESTELELGGPHWRTQSRKTLRGVGRWAVEVRDSEARVLARATFTCTPAGR